MPGRIHSLAPVPLALRFNYVVEFQFPRAAFLTIGAFGTHQKNQEGTLDAIPSVIGAAAH
jgi:hypothetical protein